ncbi:baseplate J/gp47 family protein [Rhodopila sp.]|uniref:baseplate J/gp47 family protein n=1 Tax=Rhodopila sp. TaxID=2480087 RepID=UPI003D09833B
MPLPIPTRAALQQQVLADMNARIAGADSSLRFSTIRILAYVWAGSLWLTYRFIVWLSKQLFIDSAETAYLERRLAAYGIMREGATFAAGNAVFAGTPGIDIPLGTQVQTTDASVQFATQADTQIAAGNTTVTVAIVASVAGSAGNLPANAPLNLSTAIAGIQPVANVDGNGLSGGTDAETDAALRIRGQQRIQQPPQGGAGTDYVAWAKRVAGVTRVWVYPLLNGPGTVGILFVMDGRANNIPLSADIAAVQAAINAARPVTAAATVSAPIADTLAITILNLAPNTTAMQQAVIAQLDALALTVPAGAATIGDGVSAAQPGGILYLEAIYAAISAAGATAFDLTAPTADVSFAQGHVPAVPTVSF